MPTELREARIKVVLDLGDAKKEATTLEKRTKETRKEQAAAKKEAPARGEPQKRIDVRRMFHGNLASNAAEALKSLPAFLGVVAAIGIGVAEMNERFGSGGRAMFNELMDQALPGQAKKVLDLLKATNPLFAYGEEMAEWYVGAKAWLTSLSQAAQQTGSVAAAISRTGGTISAQEAGDIFTSERKMAEFEIRVEKTRRFIMQEEAGAGIGRALAKAIKEGRPGVGK